MQFNPVAQGASIVLRGNFNPAIFSPAWFTLHEIIPGFDPDKASVQIIHGEYTDVAVEGMRVTVQQDRFSIETNTEPFVAMLDVVIKSFGTALPHTPIRQVGVNYSIHFPLHSPSQRLQFGRALAPLAPWGAWGKGIEKVSNDPETAGGLRTLVIEEVAPDGREKGGYRRVQVEPSLKEELLDKHVGVFVLVNDHFMVESGESGGDAVKAMTLLSEQFDSSIARSKAIVAGLMDFASTLK